jgi:PIN domain nuclease of toxin-antitoxin system
VVLPWRPSVEHGGAQPDRGFRQYEAVSPASYWELAIKISLRKYTLHESFEDFIQHAVLDNGFAILPIEPRHTAALIPLPYHHKDPFDRLIIAQALVEGISIVSADAQFDAYGIKRLW